MKRFLLWAALLSPTAALAQSQADINAEFFRPAPGNGFLGARDARLLTHLNYQIEALLNFADDPAVLIEDRGGEQQELAKIVDSQSALDLLAAVGIKDYLELGIALPVALFQAGDAQAGITDSPVQSGKLGDIRLSAKARLVGDPKKSDGFFLSFTPEVTLPTGSGENFFGAVSASALVPLSAAWHIGRFALAATAGPRFQQAVELANLTLGSAVEVQLGTSYKINDRVKLLGEADSAFSLTGGIDAGQLPAEARAGASIKLAKGVYLPIGAGAGLVNGLGSPDFRIIAGLTFAPERIEDPDPDRDGILGAADACPTVPEDFDQVEDTDGCIDDNDKDGVADKEDSCIDVPGPAELNGCPDQDGDKLADKDDKCPTEPGAKELQGCPETDRDKDGIADKNDVCPDTKGLAEYKGCPDTDLDKLADNLDKCPKDPEDRDGFEDEDGCPDPDNDKDKVADKDDLCPVEKEDGKGKAPKDGCPDEVKAVISGGQLFILDKVFFDVNKDTLKKVSFPVLDAVAKVLSDHPEVKRVRVEGHTDDQGSDSANLDLSKRRAKRVMDYLISKGIDAGRLESEGYGETVPLVPIADLDPKKDKKALAAARDQNRRVQFTILDPKP